MTNEIFVGIDFGTTNTVISVFENNKSTTLKDGIFNTIPSKIGYDNMGNFFCGNYIPINTTNIIHSFKISEKSIIICEKEYNYSSILILFFQHIKSIITKYYPNNIIKAVITVPSNFNDMQREIIKKCFISVGINVIRIINEPSAAALAYGLKHSGQDNEKILVIDTGGGTMDFTILEKTELFFEVIHSEGLNDLGGNNFTNIIINNMKKTLDLSYIPENIIWNQAQRIKEKLTYLDSYEVKINNTKYNLTKTRFENLSSILMKKVETVLSNIIKYYQDIHYIVLVGGTSRIPFIQKKIQTLTGKTPWIHPNLESVVSEGAAFYCGIIENKYTINEDVVLMDVLPLSLGVELADGTYSIIVSKNTPLPVKRTQKYTIDTIGENTVTVKVYQGERKIANKNFLIGTYVFDKVTLSGVPIIEITFKVDLNSIINVIITDKKSGIEKSILIKEHIVDNNEIETIITESNKMADIDNEMLSKIQHIYMIRTHIENAISNLENNETMLEQFRDIEEKLDDMNNLQLIETYNMLQSKYNILSNMNSNDDNILSIETIIVQEKKENLINRIQLLLVKNPDWSEYLEPVLTELGYSSCTNVYIEDKMKTLESLESLYNESKKDYKQEVNNLCMYLKSEIESGNINLGDNNILLVDYINSILLLLNQDNIDWKEKLDDINKKCEEIYKL